MKISKSQQIVSDSAEKLQPVVGILEEFSSAQHLEGVQSAAGDPVKLAYVANVTAAFLKLVSDVKSIRNL